MPMHQSLADMTLTQMAMPAQTVVSAITGSTIDTQGWDGVLFHVNVGAITGSGTLDVRIVRDDNSGMSTPVNVTNAALAQVTNANPNTVHGIDVYRPSERYVRCVVTQATAAVIASVTATLYKRNGVMPPTQSFTQLVRVVDS